MKILLVLTSHNQLGNTGQKTGFWLEEFATPYYIFQDANADVTLASPGGGQRSSQAEVALGCMVLWTRQKLHWPNQKLPTLWFAVN